MTFDVRTMNRLLLVSVLWCGACRNSSHDAPPPPPPAATPAEQAAKVTPPEQVAPSATTPPPPPPKVDTVDLASLKAGLAAMLPRITARQEPVAKITPTEQSRFFMHPDVAKTALLEFNTKGLSSLELAPFIQDFAGNPTCANEPTAGVVQLTWSTDTGKKNSLTVDRNYTGTVPVDLTKASRLKVEVDKGNGTTVCDWFSVGMLNVK